MRAVLVNDYGPSENLVLADVPPPQLGAREVLVKVAYAGLRWGDIMQRNGFPSRARPTPFIAGQEASGIVEAVGAEVKTYKPGMRVMAMPLNGAWAEYLAVPESRLVAVPERV